MWWKTGSVWIWLRHQKQSKTLSGPVSDPSKLGTIMVLALVKLLLKIVNSSYTSPQTIFKEFSKGGERIFFVICDAYTPAGEPIPTNKRHNAAKIFSHPYVASEEPWKLLQNLLSHHSSSHTISLFLLIVWFC
ncbi:hypothetical protein HN51_067491 [Arachis hypogaea]|uniref:glutamine synthetase nodule isozyme isoform X2 n=1 Tax=Arachis hypogaea TaxID=3818 RepID=UPI0034E7E1EF